MKKTTKIIFITLFSLILVACGNKKTETVAETILEEKELQTVAETETDKEVIKETAKLEIIIELKDYNKDTSSPIISEIFNKDQNKTIFSVMDIEKTKQKDLFILSKKVEQNVNYDINLISPINENGSIYEIDKKINIPAITEDSKKVKTESKYISPDKVTKKQLDEIVKKTSLAIENGDETLIKENGKKVLKALNKNIKNSPIAKKEEIKIVDTKVVQEIAKETITETVKEVAKETVAETKPKEIVKETVAETKPKETVKETVRETPRPVVKETPKETVKETQAEKTKTKVWVVDVPAQDPVYENKWVVDVKSQPAVYENKCTVTKEAWTETTDELIDFDQIVKERWFVKEASSGKITYFYSSKEASDYHVTLGNKGIVSNWGTAEDEVIITNKKYKTIEHPAETSCKDVLVKEAVEEKGHYEKVLIKPAVEEKGHYEYR